MHRHANIRHVCETYGQQVLGHPARATSTFSVAKLFFAYGIGNSVFFPFSVGARTVLERRRPTPDVVAERVQQPSSPRCSSRCPRSTPRSRRRGCRTTRSRRCGWRRPPASRCRRRCWSGSAPASGSTILDGIGSTEALHIFLSNRPGAIRPGTTGVPVPGYDIEIRDADGRGHRQPDSRARSTCAGSRSRSATGVVPTASRQVFQGAWLSTGDTYVRDADGYYICLGRNSDMLKAGGIWVSPAEVESRLLAHPDVQQAAVVGVPDEHGIDKPVGVVVAEGVDEAELVAWCREGLAHFKAPRQVIFVDDLPEDRDRQAAAVQGARPALRQSGPGGRAGRPARSRP